MVSKPKVLIACEFSGIVRDEFRKAGCDAWSCDLLPTEIPGNHHQCDFRDIINQDWDFVGYHIDCRVMENSGVRWLHTKPGRREELKEAAALFNVALSDPRPGYVENSVMHCHAKRLIRREQDQTIQPWMFGEPFFKATCLWLRGGLPLLEPTQILERPKKGTPEHKAWSMVHRATPGKDRWMKRSRTFPGIAKAFADQWAPLLFEKAPTAKEIYKTVAENRRHVARLRKFGASNYEISKALGIPEDAPVLQE